MLSLFVCLQLIQFFGNACVPRIITAMSDDHSGASIFSLLHYQNLFSIRLLTHDRGKLAQQKFARRDSFRQSNRQQLS